MRTYTSFLNMFYGDESADKAAAEKAAADKAAAEKAAAEKAAAEKNTRFFTQEEVNAMLAENKRTLQQKVAELSSQTTDIPKYQSKLQELQNALMTKEELAKQEAERKKAEYDSAVQRHAEEANQWKSKYLENQFDVAIADAAAKNEAYDKDQLALIMKPHCKVSEITNDKGEGTGRYHVIATIEEGGKQLTLPLNDAVAKLKENTKYANQFRTGKIPGTGGSNFNRDHGNPSGTPTSMGDFLKLTRNMKAAGTL